MNSLAPNVAEPVFQRAVGRASIASKVLPSGVTGLDRLHQKGSFRVVFPRADAGRLDAVMVNTAGGVTGGDSFEISATAAANTQLCITTQAAERIYRATAGAAGKITTSLTVADHAQLFWVPQETILFDGCALRRNLTADIGTGGRLIMLEPLVFGRAASGETLKSCDLCDNICLTAQGKPLYLDRINLQGDTAAMLERSAVAGTGIRAMANLVLVDDQAASYLPTLRSILPNTGGASLVNDRTLVVRLLCEDSHILRKILMPILTLLTHNALPKNWRL
jgi:urease accessory protein